jgi:hypothetical protein
MSGGAERAVGHSLLRVVCVLVRDGYELACKPAGAPPVIATDESDLTATQTARPQLGSTAGAPTRPRSHVRGLGSTGMKAGEVRPGAKSRGVSGALGNRSIRSAP